MDRGWVSTKSSRPSDIGVAINTDHHRHAQSSDQAGGHVLVSRLHTDRPEGEGTHCPAAAVASGMSQGHAGHGKTYVVAQYLCLVGHAKASNTWSFLVYSEQTSFKTLKSLARLTGLDAGVPIEVQNAVDEWLEKYRKRQEQGQLAGRSHVKKEPGTEERTQPLWQQPGAEVKPEQ